MSFNVMLKLKILFGGCKSELPAMGSWSQLIRLYQSDWVGGKDSVEVQVLNPYLT